VSSSRRRAFHKPRGRLRLRRGCLGQAVFPGGGEGGAGARAASKVGELIMGRGWSVRCRVGMKQEGDRLHGGKNLKYKYIKVLSAVEWSLALAKG